MIIENIYVDYDDFILDIKKLVIKDNFVNLIIGKSGSGKTTLARLLSGNICNSKDFLYINKNKINRKELYQSVEFLPTNQLFINNCTVFDLLYYKANRYYSTEESIKKIDYYLNCVSLNNKKNEKIRYLSNGEKKRLGVICSLITNKDIIILDEPNNDLDYNNSKKVFDTVLNEKNKTIIIISHKYDYIMNDSTNVISLDNGKIKDAIEDDECLNNNFRVKGYKKKLLFKYDLKALGINYLLKFFSFILIFLVSFSLFTTSFFVSSISKEKKYNNEENIFTGYNYNLEVVSKDEKIPIEKLMSIIEQNICDVYSINCSPIRLVNPVYDDIKILSGRNIMNNDEALLALSPSNYNVNKEKYDEIIGKYKELIFYQGFQPYSYKTIKKNAKIVGIAESNYNVYSDNIYFCSKDLYENYSSFDILGQFGFWTDNINYRNISFKNIVIDNGLSDFTISYGSYNGNRIHFTLSCYEYNCDYYFNFINGTDVLKMNQRTYDELFDSNIAIRSMISFKNKDDIHNFKKVLDDNNICYHDLSVYDDNYFLLFLTISFIISLVLTLSLLVLVNKKQKDKFAFYYFCKTTKGEIILSDVIINIITLLMCDSIIYFIIKYYFFNHKRDSILYYYLFGYPENIFLVQLLVYNVLVVLLSSLLLAFKNESKIKKFFTNMK